MDNIQEFVDERHKSWCIHCGRALCERDSNRDHVPSKCLLREPFPANLPLVTICTSCNNGFSRDEEYFIALLGCVLSGSTDPARQGSERAKRILQRSPKLLARIEAAKREYNTIAGETRLLWNPEIDRVNRVIVKNARGHVFYEYGEPMLENPLSIWSAPLETLTAESEKQFETIETSATWPEVGSRMLTRLITGQDLSDGWVTVQDGVYRYAVTCDGAIRVKSVVLEYRATEVRWAD